MPWRDLGREPTMRDRVERFSRRWPESSVEFCCILGFFYGIIFVTDPVFHTIHGGRGFGVWGEAGLFALGIVFLVFSLAGMLYPERGLALTFAFIICAIGAIAAFFPFSIAALIIWFLLLYGAIVQTIRRVHRTGST
jgi:hypothetical protein